MSRLLPALDRKEPKSCAAAAVAAAAALRGFHDHSFHGGTVNRTGTVNAHRPCSLYSSASLPLPCAMYRKRSMAVRLNPHCQVCRTNPGCCLAQTPKACRPLLRLLIPFPHFEFRYPPARRIRKLPLSFPTTHIFVMSKKMRLQRALLGIWA